MLKINSIMIATQIYPSMTGAKIAPKVTSALDQACARLKSAGLRITQPRIAILNALIKRAQPASIEQVHTDLADSSCDLVTVYRCLAVFEELGFVRRSFLHNGTALYEINLNGTNHYHIVCKDTHRVEEIDGETASELRRVIKQIEDVLKNRGYNDVTHVVEFFGVSPSNRKNSEASAAR
ncbi:MAG TPA: Fur family transcriptional regulator [Opitutaceae bacterium]|nr:Fur family transcriptional regulator [Opitutaceae bacterium]